MDASKFKDGQKVRLVETVGYPIGTHCVLNIQDGMVWVVVGRTQQGGVMKFRLDHESAIEPL